MSSHDQSLLRRHSLSKSPAVAPRDFNPEGILDLSLILFTSQWHAPVLVAHCSVGAIGEAPACKVQLPT